MKRLPPWLWLLKVKANLFKTFYINFKFFPFKIAIKLPIVIIGKIDLGDCKTGKIIIKSKPRFAMLVIGDTNPPHSNRCLTTFIVDGTLEIDDHIRIKNGCSVKVYKDACLTIGKQVLVNVLNRIWCHNKIIIGNNCRLSWESQVIDSNGHYMVDTKGFTKRHTGPIVIGDSCWIGNRVNIMKGTILPNSTTVAAMSFVNKDFSSQGEAIIIGGIPAKFISQGNKRIMNLKKERELDEFFENHPEIDSYQVGKDPSLYSWY